MALFTQLQFYRDRAAQARADADAAILDNVRDRCLRSEAAWTVLADRAEKTEQLRSAQEAAKAAALEAQEIPAK
jgi:hypothetical protein